MSSKLPINIKKLNIKHSVKKRLKSIMNAGKVQGLDIKEDSDTITFTVYVKVKGVSSTVIYTLTAIIQN